MLEHGIDVSYETVRRWTVKFGPLIAHRLRRRQPRPGDVWPMDEVVVKVAGRSYWLWRAVDQHGGPKPTFSGGLRCCGAARRSGHSLCLQMPFNIHALMENSDDGDHFATGLKIDRMPTYQRLEISRSDQNRAAVPFSCRNVFKHVDNVVGVSLSLLNRPLSRCVCPDMLQILFRHRRKHISQRHQVRVF